ncbi:sigma-70 family RNA polymerase sigma factor [Roseimaritima sediminicola]|uniref:sigma-70 family RNA polymerase sigma factor n=1 Tax=Roseimaritima sediminicola TaxID=2662066 RepID=UPI001EED93B8|nr:sigma-70 family RNA polymerase sigma factor [Roseimaritima sediminicola]
MAVAKAGDSEALGELLEQYRGFLLMRAHRYMDERLRRRVDPADVVQLTFLEAQRDLASFRGSSPAEFGAWLKNILRHNLATAVARHVTTQKRSLNRETHPSPRGGDDSAGNWIAALPDQLSTPSGQAMRAEAAMELIESLHQLPEAQAEAIRLRYMEGRTLAEIVERMGRSETAVAGLLKRGLQKLRGILVDPE